MTAQLIRNLGAGLASAWLERRQIDASESGGQPLTVADGYRVQDALVAAMGRPVVGYKVGATHTSLQRYFHVTEPFYGRLFADFVAPAPLTIEYGHVLNYAIEAEFVFRMGSDLPADRAPYDRDRVIAAIATVHPGIEAPDSRFRNWQSVGIANLIADNAIASWLAYGRPNNDWNAAALAHHKVSVQVNGATVASGGGGNVLGNPIEALTWLANALADHGRSLCVGDLVTTGSTTELVLVKPGDEVTADFQAFGQATVRFADAPDAASEYGRHLP